MILTQNNIDDNYIPSSKIEELVKTYDSLNQKQKEIINNFFYQPENSRKYYDLLQSMMWVYKCPTPEEFLDARTGFLPVNLIDGLYSYIKENFIEAMNIEIPFSNIVFYGSTRTGKSILSRLIMVYAMIFVNYLRFPHLYFQLNQMSDLCFYLVSFKATKTNQLLLSPILNILSASNKFHRTNFEHLVKGKPLRENGVILYTEASKFGGITSNNLTFVTGANPGDFVGGDIICAVVSEINWFKKYAHISDEEVLTVYTKLNDRIRGTSGVGRFPCFSLLDSSSNESESPIEKLIQEELRKRLDTFYKEYIRWEVRPHLYPKWVKANILEGENIHDSKTWKKSWSTKDRPNETFEICSGDSGIPAFLVKEEIQKKGVDEKLFFRAPIDTKNEFEVNLLDSIKDIAGKPSSSESKLISDRRIIDSIWDENLDNIEGEIIAGAKSLPDKLIWNQIYRKFFIDRGNGKFQILRAPREQRFIGIDTAVAIQGCVMGVSVVHPEIGYDGEILAVNDFSLAITPDSTGINLDALNLFILDLMMLGHLSINVAAFDQFQSKQTQQNLERAGINCIQFSVDVSVEPYQYFVGILYNGLYKSGRNIYLKNNLDSLYRGTDTKGNEKVLKTKGTPVHKYNGNWELSTAGKYEKDVSDATCRAVYLMMHNKDVMPVTLYEEENRRIGLKNKLLNNRDINGGSIDQYLFKKLHGLKF